MGTNQTTLKQALRDQIRHEIGDTPQAQIARKAGVSSSALSRWLDDEKDRGFKVADLEKVAAALGLSVGELLTRAERRRASPTAAV